jgi:ElaB/YqjD/DUF883 family membrane-anchored ribosome-binding protein
MEIKVLKTTTASKNQTGTECFEYLQGEIYDIYDELAEVFLKEGWGEKAIDNLEDTEETIEELENKAIDNLENKQFKTKKVNKNAE